MENPSQDASRARGRRANRLWRESSGERRAEFSAGDVFPGRAFDWLRRGHAKQREDKRQSHRHEERDVGR